jgi:hypothetical protein
MRIGFRTVDGLQIRFADSDTSTEFDHIAGR